MSDRSQRLTKRQRRLSERVNEPRLLAYPTLANLHMELTDIGPITDNQIKAFQSYSNNEHMFLLGSAGTGKTFISIYLAMKEIEQRKTRRNKLIIIRTSQPTKNMGFLKGDEKQKMEVYEAPYRSIVNNLFNRDDAYDILKLKGIIDFQSTSFLRGVTFDDSIILLDEVQSMSKVEWITVLTRVGDKSRVIICGDTKQDDLTSERFNEQTGVYHLIDVFDSMPNTSLVTFTEDDIVRSGFVRDLIISMNKLGI
jgi:phosphate starvation-inducible PhoH-like protein